MMSHILTEETIKAISTVAAEKAIEAYKKEIKSVYQAETEQRIQNTKLILQNYHKFKGYFEASTKEFYFLYDDTGKALKINQIIVSHIDSMLQAYKNCCERSSKEGMRRRWKAIELFYLVDERLTLSEIAEREFVTDRTVLYDLKAAYKDLSELFFGIDLRAMFL